MRATFEFHPWLRIKESFVKLMVLCCCRHSAYTHTYQPWTGLNYFMRKMLHINSNLHSCNLVGLCLWWQTIIYKFIRQEFFFHTCLAPRWVLCRIGVVVVDDDFMFSLVHSYCRFDTFTDRSVNLTSLRFLFLHLDQLSCQMCCNDSFAWKALRLVRHVFDARIVCGLCMWMIVDSYSDSIYAAAPIPNLPPNRNAVAYAREYN